MKQTVQSELDNWIPLDDTYNKQEEDVAGYEDNQAENVHMQLILEDELERMLNNNEFVVANNGKLFHIWCTHCEHVPCAWEANQQSMIDFDQAQHEEDTKPNKSRAPACTLPADGTHHQ
jgi:hypothetical protein